MNKTESELKRSNYAWIFIGQPYWLLEPASYAEFLFFFFFYLHSEWLLPLGAVGVVASFSFLALAVNWQFHVRTGTKPVLLVFSEFSWKHWNRGETQHDEQSDRKGRMKQWKQAHTKKNSQRFQTLLHSNARTDLRGHNSESWNSTLIHGQINIYKQSVRNTLVTWHPLTSCIKKNYPDKTLLCWFKQRTVFFFLA